MPLAGVCTRLPGCIQQVDGQTRSLRMLGKTLAVSLRARRRQLCSCLNGLEGLTEAERGVERTWIGSVLRLQSI
jgi:hypothetical protein